MRPWIGVDLDGTLAEYNKWDPDPETGRGRIGEPVPEMLERVKRWLAAGKVVKIFTARASRSLEVAGILGWLDRVGLPELEITNVKDFGMIELWDDRTVRVAKNTGEPCCASVMPMCSGDGCDGCGAYGEDRGAKEEPVLWHTLSSEEQERIVTGGGMTIKQFMQKYRQPRWCQYPEALSGEMGCWSLVSRRIHGEDDCKGCDMYYKEAGA